jgi:hypothetical protein
MYTLNAALKVTSLLSDCRCEEEVSHRMPTRCATLRRKAMLQQRASG